ncbi:MAG: hypothetical protein AAB241_02200, partial [Pseudomonadota bacterium]
LNRSHGDSGSLLGEAFHNLDSQSHRLFEQRIFEPPATESFFQRSGKDIALHHRSKAPTAQLVSRALPAVLKYLLCLPSLTL